MTSLDSKVAVTQLDRDKLLIITATEPLSDFEVTQLRNALEQVRGDGQEYLIIGSPGISIESLDDEALKEIGLQRIPE